MAGGRVAGSPAATGRDAPRRERHGGGGRRHRRGLLAKGCGGGADLGGAPYTSIESRGHDLVPGSTVTLTFADERISANAGCNTLNGAASWEGGTLAVEGPLASTMMACEETLMAQDTWLSEFLTSSPDLAVEGDELVLGDDTTGPTLSRKT